MDIKEPMTMLLLEDDVNACEEWRNFIDRRKDIKLVATTNSATTALEYVNTYLPEAIIVDIELDKGEGSGVIFLEKLKELSLDVMPMRIVTTNIDSTLIDHYAHNGHADMVFHKGSQNYSLELVIANMLALRRSLHDQINRKGNMSDIQETEASRFARISNMVDSELDQIGIKSHLLGRGYLHDAICYLVQDIKLGETILIYLAKKNGKTEPAIFRSMETVIRRAWSEAPTKDIEEYYTQRYDYERGAPTPTEFIYYYVNKIKKKLS